MTSTTSERTPFIAPLVDKATQFIKEHGAVTISELAEYLSTAGVNADGDEELTGKELAYFRRKKGFQDIPVIASGSFEFLRIIAAVLVNRNVKLDAANRAQAKLVCDGSDYCAVPPEKYRGFTGGHYHILTVRDLGDPQQIAQCWREETSLTLVRSYADEDFRLGIDEGWDAIWIVGCGPDRCRKEEICKLSVYEWGDPYWLR
jgi:hypothetical protein